jgi:hypothetical protein
MWKILLNDGSEYVVKWCGANSGVLWIDGLVMTILEAIPIFSDQTKTSHIIAPGNVSHDGYINLIHISAADGLVKVALRQ